MPGKGKFRYQTGAGLLCAGLLYAYVLIPLGLRLPCPFFRLTGLRCPGCGITDACLALLHGRFRQAAGCNWGLTLALPVLTLLAILLTQGKSCRRIDRILSAAVLAWLLLWGVVRNLLNL